jgi:hypothetical protein
MYLPRSYSLEELPNESYQPRTHRSELGTWGVLRFKSKPCHVDLLCLKLIRRKEHPCLYLAVDLCNERLVELFFPHIDFWNVFWLHPSHTTQHV